MRITVDRLSAQFHLQSASHLVKDTRTRQISVHFLKGALHCPDSIKVSPFLQPVVFIWPRTSFESGPLLTHYYHVVNGIQFSPAWPSPGSTTASEWWVEKQLGEGSWPSPQIVGPDFFFFLLVSWRHILCVFFLHPACRPSVSVLVDGKNGFTTRKKTQHSPPSNKSARCLVHSFFRRCQASHLSVECLSVLAGSDRRLRKPSMHFYFLQKFRPVAISGRSGHGEWGGSATKKRITPANPARPSHQINKCTC